MSSIAVNAITDANAGNTATINSVTPNVNNVLGKNLVINGAMQIAQRGTSVSGVTSGDYRAVDRFKIMIGTAGTWTISQDTDAPDGFGNSLKYSCTTATASPTYVFLEHRMEGQMLQQLAKGTASAKKVTLSFYVKCSKTGNFQVNLRDKDNSRIIGNVVTISSANTWEKKTITFDGDTTGTLNNDNGESLTLEMFFDAGSSFNTGAVPTSWETEAATDRAAGVTLALADSASNTLNITGVQLEAGSSATEFEHRQYGTELALCQRYYQKFGGSSPYPRILMPSYTTNAYVGGSFPYVTSMRATPTGAFVGTWINQNTLVGNNSISTGPEGFLLYTQSSSTVSISGLYPSATGFITLSSEL
jgi:hypothetical protein